jgi:hypothetical protein
MSTPPSRDKISGARQAEAAGAEVAPIVMWAYLGGVIKEYDALVAERDALRAAIQAVEGHAKIEAEKHLPDMQNGGCTCGFCAYSIEHVVVMSLRAALAAAGVDREDTEQPDDEWGHKHGTGQPCPIKGCWAAVGDTGQADEPQREACWSRGPRIGGDGVARCVLPRGHGARHRADASWGDVTWDDIAGQVVPQQPTCQALTNGMRCEIGGFSAHTHFPSGDTTGEQQ